MGPVLFASMILLPIPSMADTSSKIPLAPQVALGTMLWMVTWWITECVPLGLTGLLAPMIFSVTGILSAREALLTFSDPIIWIFIAGFILASTFQKWGLDRRIAFSLALLYRGSNPQLATFFVASLPAFLLTMTGSITVSAVIVFPFLTAFIKTLNIPLNGKSNYAEASFLALGQAATTGAMLLLISTAPNLIAKATIERFTGKTISFFDWFIIGSPHALIGLIISWAIIFLFIKPEISILSSTYKLLNINLKGMGKITREEKVTLAILLAALSLWIVPSLMRTIGNAEIAFAKNIPESIPALMIILAVGLIRVRGTSLLKWDEMAKAVDWNIVLLFGGGLVLGLGIERSGLASWMSTQIASTLGTDITPWTIFAVSAIMGYAVSYAASNTASALITCPLAATLAIGVGIDPTPPILAAGLASSISSAIPSTTPPMAIVYSSKAVSILKMFKTGMISDLTRLALLIVLGPILIELLI